MMPAAKKPSSHPAVKPVIDAAKKRSPGFGLAVMAVTDLFVPVVVDKFITPENLSKLSERLPASPSAKEKVDKLESLTGILDRIAAVIAKNPHASYSDEQVEEWQARIERLRAKGDLVGTAQKKTRAAEIKQLETQIEELRSEVFRALDGDAAGAPTEAPKSGLAGRLRRRASIEQPEEGQ